MTYCSRLGFNPTFAVVELLWSKLLKNKDGSVHPQELIRHFSKIPSPPPQCKYNKEMLCFI